MYKGSCLCGKIRYAITGELGDFGYCHCTRCQKASGSSHAANSGVDAGDFKLADPDGVLREFESSPGKFRAFCSNCGSPVYARLAFRPGVYRIRLGTLDTPLDRRARAHTFVSEMPSWDLIEGYQELPRFDGWAPRDVLVQKGSRQPNG